MLFNSYIFIFLFLPICFAGYFLLNRVFRPNYANIFLIAMSLWFYGYYNPYYLAIIVTSILFNYAISLTFNKNCGTKVPKKLLLSLGISVNVISIFYFKYFDFFIQNVNHIFKTSFELRHILLPLGISFFTFQQISYLVDSYKGQTKDYSFIEYALFVVYFPQLIAGPIVLHSETIPQFRRPENRHLNYDNIAHGIYIFSIGLFKKVMIADALSQSVNWGYSNIPDLSRLEAIIVSICYTLQLYFDFSGYCDMAVGISKLFNINLPQNFNSPYKALSIDDFWNRWHMSLTRFLRQYIYFPLGGSKKGTVRTYINIMIVFLVSGIWHGANWTFIIWGLLHGLFNCISKICQKPLSKIPKIIRWLVTFNIVNMLWVIFRSEDLIYAKAFIGRILYNNNLHISQELADTFYLSKISFLLVCFIIVLFTKNTTEVKFKPSIKASVMTVILLVCSIMSLGSVSEFLYFGF